MADPLPPRPASRLTKRTLSDALSTLDSALKPSPLPLPTSKRPRPTPTSTRALESLLSLRQAPPRSLPSSPQTLAPDSYTPNSLPSLLDRLSSYRLTSYSPLKPFTISPLECALHGWTNTGKERLTCQTCKKSIVLLPPTTGSWNDSIGKAMREEYEKLVGKKGHEENCPWGLRPCSKNLYRLQGGGLGVSKGGRRRLLEIVGEEARGMDEKGLKGIQLELPQELVLDEEKLRRNVTALLSPPHPPPTAEEQVHQVSTTSILLAIFGWTLSPIPTSPSSSLTRSNSSSSSSISSSSTNTKNPPILSCHYCLRQILVTPYLPGSEGEKRRKLLNPINQHYNYCPFISTTIPPSSSTSSSKEQEMVKKPGWQVRLEAVLGKNGNETFHERMGSMRNDSNRSIGGEVSERVGGEGGEGEGGGGIEKSSSTIKVSFPLVFLCRRLSL